MLQWVVNPHFDWSTILTSGEKAKVSRKCYDAPKPGETADVPAQIVPKTRKFKRTRWHDIVSTLAPLHCGICPNEAAVGSEAIVSATAKARCGDAGGPGGIPLASFDSCRQHARCEKPAAG